MHLIALEIYLNSYLDSSTVPKVAMSDRFSYTDVLF